MFLFNYANYFSSISVVIILLLIIFTVLGFKYGFVRKFLDLANALCGLLFSIVFCSKFSESVIHRFWGDALALRFKQNIESSESFQNAISHGINGDAFLSQLGLPDFIAKNIKIDLDLYKVSASIAENMSKFVCVIISFLCLFIGTTIVVFILKLCMNILRTSKIVRLIDGILGIVLYDLLFYVVLCLILLVISFVYSSSVSDSFNSFILNDMKLGVDGEFRISKYLYDNNIIGNFLRMFF